MDREIGLQACYSTFSTLHNQCGTSHVWTLFSHTSIHTCTRRAEPHSQRIFSPSPLSDLPKVGLIKQMPRGRSRRTWFPAVHTHTHTHSSQRVNSPRTPRLDGRRREFIYSKCTRKTVSSRLVRMPKALCAEKSIGRDNLPLKCHQQETVGVSPGYLRRDSGKKKKKKEKRNPTLNPSAIPTEA